MHYVSENIQEKVRCKFFTMGLNHTVGAGLTKTQIHMQKAGLPQTQPYKSSISSFTSCIAFTVNHN